MPPPTSGSPRRCQPLRGHESPPPVISDSDSTPKLPPIRHHILDDHSDPPSIRSDTLDVIERSRNDDEVRVAVNNLRRSSSLTRIVFNSLSTLDSNDSLPSLIRSQRTSSSTSANSSLCGSCGKGSTPVVKQADCSTRSIDAAKNSGAYVDHENWMSSSIELEAADARKAITVMKGRKQVRCPAAPSLTAEGEPATEASRVAKMDAHGSRRSLLLSGRKRSVRINTPPESPREAQSQMELRPLQTAVLMQQQEQLLLLPINRSRQLQPQQHPMQCPSMPASSGLSTLLPLPSSPSTPHDMNLRPVTPTVTESPTSGLTLSSTASCQTDPKPLSSTSEESGAVIGAALKKIFSLCSVNTKEVVLKGSA
ncbi:hypothetical protein GH5_01558 [Leishmania sp. Ghana 2012 LV757]|uniref:hypothetical protein n=1 Tax=Leishmania sp. Ghana 2012 LV757 TaxID=2803181 RepID=UPI001B427E62|nr:hypothetical protein GH5_01558 [Leishmania sp. Ghana 2012 LV757]